jgi:hypothetical protein
MGTLPLIKYAKARLAWASVDLPDGDSDDERDAATWWQHVGPWKVALCLENATLDMPASEMFV